MRFCSCILQLGWQVAIISWKRGCATDAVPLYQYTGTHFVDSACHPSEVSKMRTSVLVEGHSISGTATHPRNDSYLSTKLQYARTEPHSDLVWKSLKKTSILEKPWEFRWWRVKAELGLHVLRNILIMLRFSGANPTSAAWSQLHHEVLTEDSHGFLCCQTLNKAKA